MKLNVTASLIATVIITLISVVIGTILNTFTSYTSNIVTPILSSFATLLLIFFIFRNKIINFLIIKIFNTFFAGFREKTGLIKIYNNFDEASFDIKSEFEIASNVSVFIQLGRGVIGGQNSLLFDKAKKRRDPSFKFRLLFSKLESKWLSQEKAEERNSNYREWESVVNYNIDNISVLEIEGINIDARKHSEPYLWRLFFFDNIAYFIPYLYERRNDKHAPVFKFGFFEQNPSFYKIFMRYFDDIWEKNVKNCIKIDK